MRCCSMSKLSEYLCVLSAHLSLGLILNLKPVVCRSQLRVFEVNGLRMVGVAQIQLPMSSAVSDLGVEPSAFVLP